MQRGFDPSEFQNRLDRAQSLMAGAGLDALVLTTETDVRYFTGFLTRFWESPTRPWFLVVPQTGMPVAVIPSIGAALMRKTWITDIRTWSAPDLTDDGVTLLTDTIRHVVGAGARIGCQMGMAPICECHCRIISASRICCLKQHLPAISALSKPCGA